MKMFSGILQSVYQVVASLVIAGD